MLNAARGGPAALSVIGLAVTLIASACAPIGTATPPSSAAGSASPGTPVTASPSAPATASGISGAPESGSPAPTVAGDPEHLALYQAIEDQVSALRGLPIKERLVPQILSEDQVRTSVRQQFEAKNPPDRIAESEVTLRALGLLGPGESLSTLYLDLMGAQVAGFYDPKARTISVVARSGAIGAVEKETFAHEFDHALQDQAFGLAGIGTDTVGQGDRSLARLALVEGDASVLMTQWMLGNLDSAEISDIVKGDPQAEAELQKAPAILRESLLFPYLQGLTFVMSAWGRDGWPAVDQLYERPPVSTEQVLHPEKYTANEVPVDVALDGSALASALGTGWTAGTADTLGEFQLRVWLAARNADAGGAVPGATDAAAGWGGDRFVLLRGPGGAYALALVTAWDTDKDAEDFQAAATSAVRGLPGASTVRVTLAPQGGASHRIVVLIASDQVTLDSLGAADPGRS